MSGSRKPYWILLFLFLVLTTVFLLSLVLVPQNTLDSRVLLVGNLVLFAVSLWSYRVNVKALHHQNLQVFLRMVYGSLFTKLILLSAAALIYISTQKRAVSKIALFGCFGLYFLYTFTEIRLVMQARKHKNV
jgi:hypothetical protein